MSAQCGFGGVHVAGVNVKKVLKTAHFHSGPERFWATLQTSNLSQRAALAHTGTVKNQLHIRAANVERQRGLCWLAIRWTWHIGIGRFTVPEQCGQCWQIDAELGPCESQSVSRDFSMLKAPHKVVSSKLKKPHNWTARAQGTQAVCPSKEELSGSRHPKICPCLNVAQVAVEAEVTASSFDPFEEFAGDFSVELAPSALVACRSKIMCVVVERGKGQLQYAPVPRKARWHLRRCKFLSGESEGKDHAVPVAPSGIGAGIQIEFLVCDRERIEGEPQRGAESRFACCNDLSRQQISISLTLVLLKIAAHGKRIEFSSWIEISLVLGQRSVELAVLVGGSSLKRPCQTVAQFVKVAIAQNILGRGGEISRPTRPGAVPGAAGEIQMSKCGLSRYREDK